MAFLSDGRTLVTEMGGCLLTIADDGLPPIFQQGGVSGMMEVAQAPQFAQNGWL
ncbi:PQQ-dependent sugar dehydrogenase [Frateuria aurantia]|uniref:PQQ-dependent sugar dehydrogenase n=1 Tax=Frateuria aurantia TaxID=81475 RepID=UPI001C26A4BA